MHIGYIYGYRHVRLDEVWYVGRTSNLKRRHNEHRRETPQLREAFKKFGEDSFSQDVLYVAKEESKSKVNKILCEKELYFMEKYDTIKNGLNVVKASKFIERKIKMNKSKNSFLEEKEKNVANKNHAEVIADVWPPNFSVAEFDKMYQLVSSMESRIGVSWSSVSGLVQQNIESKTHTQECNNSKTQEYCDGKRPLANVTVGEIEAFKQKMNGKYFTKEEVSKELNVRLNGNLLGNLKKKADSLKLPVERKDEKNYRFM